MGLWDDDKGGIWGGGGGGIWSGKESDHQGGLWSGSSSSNSGHGGVFDEAHNATFFGGRGMWNPVNPWSKKVKSGW